MTRRLWIRCAVFLLVIAAWTVGSAQEGRGVSGGANRSAAPAAQLYLSVGPVASDVLAINPFACEGWDLEDGNALRASGVHRYCESLQCLLEAPVELPTGAVVTRLELNAVDNGPLDVKATFYRCPVGTSGCSPLAEVSTNGTPGATQVGVSLAIPESIDNQSFSYLVEIVPGEDSLTRLVGARLLFGGPESPVQSDGLAIHPYAFEGRAANDRNALRADGIQRFCDGQACVLVAPVELPSGAVVTRIELDAYDDGAADVLASFGRCLPGTGVCTSSVSVSTSGTPGSTQPGADLVSPETIDNATYSYFLKVSLGATLETRLVGLRLQFDAPASIPRTDWLSINPFAHEGMEAGDIDALEAIGDERYCSGQGCIAIAPVELPSGTIITRIELDAFDNGPSDVQVMFSRCPSGEATCSEIVALGTSGTPGAAHNGADLVVPEMINNHTATYQVAVELGDDDATRLRAVRLAYENSLIFSDGFGTGDTSSWSIAVP
jgi:hypothetical protein